jgi:pseudaminic acid synthase
MRKALRKIDMQIAGRKIGDGFAPYVIAELSANHNGSVATAKKLIDKAFEAGADAVKLQTYTPDTITIKSDLPDFYIADGLWSGKTLYELYQEAYTPWEWHSDLFDHAKKLGIVIFSSPFDLTAVDFLESLNTPAYKIASFEAIDIPLIKYVARTGKPMIISTGMANAEEIGEAIDAAKGEGCKDLAILHCVSGYPTPANEYDLRTILDMKKRYGIEVGLSDHSEDNAVAIASVALGATIIEKHFTLDRAGGSPDDNFSIEPEQFKALCRDAKVAWSALGKVSYSLSSSEVSNVKFRRSLYFVKDVKIGDIISSENVKSIRPGYGLSPNALEKILGMVVTKDLCKGSPVTLDSVKNAKKSGLEFLTDMCSKTLRNMGNKRKNSEI